MIIDFHVHGKISSKYTFDEEKFLDMINEAKKEKLDSLAITEHCHANNFLEGYNFLKTNYILQEDYFDVDNFKVFYGIEVTTKQDLDILFIAKPELIIQLREKVISNIKESKYIDINDLFNLHISDEILIILAHPYRNYLDFPKLDNYIIQKLDAIEINAKDLYKYGIEDMKDKVLKLGKKLNLPVVCGSDTHYFTQISSVRNIFSKECNTIKQIKEKIKLKEYTIEISDDLKSRVEDAMNKKRIICNKN